MLFSLEYNKSAPRWEYAPKQPAQQAVLTNGRRVGLGGRHYVSPAIAAYLGVALYVLRTIRALLARGIDCERVYKGNKEQKNAIDKPSSELASLPFRYACRDERQRNAH